MTSSAPSVVDATFNGDEAVVFGAAGIEALHGWSNGGFGELLSGAAAKTASDEAGFSLHLSPLEAFHLLSLQRLRVWEGRQAAAPTEEPGEASSRISAQASEPMDADSCWEAFGLAVPQFARQYAVYHALRTAGWNLRDGLKFGVDFTLYDQSAQAEDHAAFGALVVSADAGSDRSWLWMQRHMRVCRSVAKGLMLCSVGPRAQGSAEPGGGTTVDESTPACVARLEVNMLEFDSWSAGKEHARLST